MKKRSKPVRAVIRSGANGRKRSVADSSHGNARPRRALPRQEFEAAGNDERPSAWEAPVPGHLSQARARWYFGEWEELAALNAPALRDRPERDRFALLVASASQQLRNPERAREFTRLALEWGCPPRVVAQILIAGVHNSLGRACALTGDGERTTRHFREAVAVTTDPKEAELLSHARSVREMTRLNLLPQAVTLLDGLAKSSRDEHRSPWLATARAKVLDMEVHWLRERVLQIQRKQELVADEIVSGTFNDTPGRFPKDADPQSAERRKYFGLHELDRKLEAYIDYDDGYFVELGANDGIAQSNTYYFERERNWRGMLIEPILHNYLKCRGNRSSDNKFYCAACVSFAYEKPYVNLTYSNLMTSPSGLESDISDPVEHARSGKRYLQKGEDPVTVLATAKTLNTLLDDAQAPEFIDLLSLDVEGAEIEVLKGVDHLKYRFKYLLVESRNPEKLDAYLKSIDYSLIDKLSHHDYLYSCNMRAGKQDRK